MVSSTHTLRILTAIMILAAVFGVGQGPVVEHLTVTGTVVNSYAITHVEEVLVNPYDYKLDAAFMFKVPDGAFVSNLTLLVDGVLHVADVIPKGEAREKFDAAVSAGRDAGLMEQAGKDVFSYAVSFSPGQTIIVGLTYEMYLARVLDKYEFPLEINPGGDQHIKDLVVDITVSSYKDIAGLSVPTHPDIDIAYPGADTAKLHFERKDLSTAEKMLVSYSTAATSKAGFLLDHTENGERYFFHIFAPVVDEYGEPLDKDIVFVLDKSGSMDESACGGNRKIEQMNDAFASIVGQLRDDDTFNVIEFDSDVRVLWNELRQADQANRDEAIARIRSIEADGGTDINEGLERALAMLKVDEARVPIVVMLTDGKPSSGTTNTFSIRKNIQKVNTADVSIFSLGLGDNLDFPFLKALSLENYGHAVQIYSCEDVSEQIADFYKTISTPILKDLKFEYGEGVVDVFPTAVQRLFAGSEIVLAGRYVGDGDELTVQVSGRSHQGSVTFTETLRFTGGRRNEFIPRFWAFMSIQELLDRIAVWGENDEIVGDIVNTSVQYHFVTPYTSLFLEIERSTDTVTGDDGELEEETPLPTMAPAATPVPMPTSAVRKYRNTVATRPPPVAPPPRAPSSGGSSYLSKMAGSIMGMSDEVSDTMRERVLNDIKTKNEKVMLSIPTSIKMTRKERRRDISVVINNVEAEDQCFCVYPHLLGLDGPGSCDVMISTSTMQGSLSSGTTRAPVTDEEQLKNKLKRYTPHSCWDGAGKCKPNTWFVGEAGIRVDGEQANDVKVSLEVPRDPLEAPNGRWAFTVEVCTYVPPTGAGCNACVPENCRQRPVDECDHSRTDDCYLWYDSAAFHLQIHSEDTGGSTDFVPPIVTGHDPEGGISTGGGGDPIRESSNAFPLLALTLVITIAGIALGSRSGGA